MNTETVQIGVVGVDSGQLIICDPCYIEKEFQSPDSKGKADHAHEIYKHVTDGKLWQFTYGEEPGTERVNKFPGSYEDVIPEYGMTPNELVGKKLFERTNFDPTPHIPIGEFSYRGICKTNKPHYGQLNFKLGHPGAAVAFSSGLGDGLYNVFAEIADCGKWGKRVKKVWVEMLTDEEVEQLKNSE